MPEATLSYLGWPSSAARICALAHIFALLHSRTLAHTLSSLMALRFGYRLNTLTPYGGKRAACSYDVHRLRQCAKPSAPRPSLTPSPTQYVLCLVPDSVSSFLFPCCCRSDRLCALLWCQCMSVCMWCSVPCIGW